MSALLLATAGLVPALTRAMVRPTGPALLHARTRVHSGRASPPVLDLTDADLAPLRTGSGVLTHAASGVARRARSLSFLLRWCWAWPVGCEACERADKYNGA